MKRSGEVLRQEDRGMQESAGKLMSLSRTQWVTLKRVRIHGRILGNNMTFLFLKNPSNHCVEHGQREWGWIQGDLDNNLSTGPFWHYVRLSHTWQGICMHAPIQNASSTPRLPNFSCREGKLYHPHLRTSEASFGFQSEELHIPRGVQHIIGMWDGKITALIPAYCVFKK